MTTPDEHPYRVADREGEGWLLDRPNQTYTTYPKTQLGELTYEQLKAERGPLRPVGAMESADSKALAQALAQAGKKGMATLLAALNRTTMNLINDGSSMAVLTAGRPGSWEASLLRAEIVWLGDDIAPSRIDPAVRDLAEALLYKWTTGPVQVELADGLAGILGDAAMLAGDWAKITDRWLAGNQSIERWTAAYRMP